MELSEANQNTTAFGGKGIEERSSSIQPLPCIIKLPYLFAFVKRFGLKTTTESNPLSSGNLAGKKCLSEMSLDVVKAKSSKTELH